MRTALRLLALATSFVLISGCSPSQPLPTQSTSPTQSETPSPTPTEAQISVFYVADTPLGMKLFQEKQVLQSLGDPAVESVKRLVNGTQAPLDPDYTNLWGNGSAIASVTRDGDLATIDFSAVHLNVGAAGEMLAIDQILWTLTANDSTIARIKLLLNGQAIESLAGHVDATGTFAREDGYEVLSAVNILHPAQGSREAGDILVSGLACTFEANVAWQLWSKGHKVDSGSTLAAEACPATAPWEVELGLLDAGTYVFKAMEYSAKDGALVALDTKTFVVD